MGPWGVWGTPRRDSVHCSRQISGPCMARHCGVVLACTATTAKHHQGAVEKRQRTHTLACLSSHSNKKAGTTPILASHKYFTSLQTMR